MSDAAFGAVRMLQEGAHQFDVIDSLSDFSKYRVLVLPDDVPVSPAFARKLDSYTAGGGAIIASFESGLNEDKSEFALKQLGVKKKSEGPRDLDGSPVRGKPFGTNDYAEYIIPQGAVGKGLPETEHVMYMAGNGCRGASGQHGPCRCDKIIFQQNLPALRVSPADSVFGSPRVARDSAKRQDNLFFSPNIQAVPFKSAPVVQGAFIERAVHSTSGTSGSCKRADNAFGNGKRTEEGEPAGAPPSALYPRTPRNAD